MGFTWFKRSNSHYGAIVIKIVDEDGVERVFARGDSFPPSEWFEDSFYDRCINWVCSVFSLVTYPFCWVFFRLFAKEKDSKQTVEKNESK
jgi:hypothetical protein